MLKLGKYYLGWYFLDCLGKYFEAVIYQYKEW